MKLIAVEGNIGAGKSTALPEFASVLGYDYIIEPVDTDPKFDELLAMVTKYPKSVEARVEFQKYLTTSRANLLKGLDPQGSYVIERSLLSDIIFIQATLLQHPENVAKYLECYDWLAQELQSYPKVDVCVYLRTDPEVAYGRMVSRGRAAEAGTPLTYIKDIHNFHEALLPQTTRNMGSELVYIDWNKPRTGGALALEVSKQLCKFS